jgi:hypothetical protein
MVRQTAPQKWLAVVQYQDRDYKRALELYKSAKYSFQEVVDSIEILPYHSKYYDKAYDDE